MSVMPSQNSVRPMEVNGGEEVVTVGSEDPESTRGAEETETRGEESGEDAGS